MQVSTCVRAFLTVVLFASRSGGTTVTKIFASLVFKKLEPTNENAGGRDLEFSGADSGMSSFLFFPLSFLPFSFLEFDSSIHFHALFFLRDPIFWFLPELESFFSSVPVQLSQREVVSCNSHRERLSHPALEQDKQ